MSWGGFLSEWRAATPDYRIRPGANITYTGGGVFALRNLPLEWDS